MGKIMKDGISYSGSTYTGGTDIEITGANVINAKVRELTQAQYDALSSAEKNNGTTYYITDGIPSVIGVTDVEDGGQSIVTNHVADVSHKVNKSGDTMTGNLTIENQTNGSVQIINPNTDLEDADNGISNIETNAYSIIDGGSNMQMSGLTNMVYPNGLVQTTLQVSNFDTNGDPVSNGISLTVDKDGNKSYSVSDETAFRRAIGVVNRAAANAGADLSLVTTGDKYTWNNKVDKAGDTMTGSLSMAGTDINLKTSGSSSDDSSDIVWYYGNGQEKARLWTANEYTAESGLNFRVYKKNGTNLFSGTIPLRNTNTTYTVATGDSNGQIKVTPSSGSAYNVSVKGLGSAAYVNADTAATANTIARRQGNGYLYATYFNTTCGAENPASYTSYFAFIDSHGWLRKSNAANFRSSLGAQAALSSSAGSLSVTYNSTNAVTNNDMWYTKYGNVVQLCGSVKNKNAITIPSHGDIGDLHMFTLPSGYHPKITTGGFADNGNLVTWRIASDGKVYLTSAFRSTGTWAAGAVFGIRATFIV